MSEKEKAKELVDRFRTLPPSNPYTGIDEELAKQCALICVDEIIKDLNPFDVSKNYYWREVKNEINKT